MEERTKKALMALLLVIFVLSILRLFGYYLEYRAQEKLYEEVAETYTEMKITSAESERDEEKPSVSAETGEGGEIPPISTKEAEKNPQLCPISVDFDALLAVNEDIVGWLYCEGTNINYPIVQGYDNEYYLRHAYDKKESGAGAIFVDAGNRPDFTDSNTIIYGHNMKNGGMFAQLADWSDSVFFETHSEMWLLTPQQNYRVELFGGYLTKDASGSYTIFPAAGPEFAAYLKQAVAAADVRTETETPAEERYIMLSTCAYDFQDARYVLHGRLFQSEIRR